jgi:hypothetical protein
MFVLSPEYYEVRKTVNKGLGVFTKKEIFAGAIIGEYNGKALPIKSLSRYEKNYGLYSFCYNDQFGVFPNLKSVDTHLINHSCTPNCGVTIYRAHILFYALRKIFSGEELTFDYAAEYDSDGKYYYPCYCQSPLCRGSMYVNPEKGKKIWSSIGRATKSQLKRILVFGRLNPLTKRPSRISDNKNLDLYANFDKAPITIADKKLSIAKARKLIRTGGRKVKIKGMNLVVLGVASNRLMTEIN